MHWYWDPFVSFQWPWYGLVVLIYSAFAFKGEISLKKPHILAERCTRPARAVLIAHLTYLIGLLALYRLFVGVEPLMPGWMLQNWGRKTTPYESLFLLMVLICAMVEHKRLFLKLEDVPDDEAADSAAS